MQQERFLLAGVTFDKALARLHEVLPSRRDEFMRDALIQRFEFTFESLEGGLPLAARRGERCGRRGRCRVAPEAFASAADCWTSRLGRHAPQVRNLRHRTPTTRPWRLQVAAFVRARHAVRLFEANAGHAAGALGMMQRAMSNHLKPGAAIPGFGLPGACGTLRGFSDASPAVERVWVFGSRASGRLNVPDSDLDLALDAPGWTCQWTSVARLARRRSKRICLLFGVDVVHWQGVSDARVSCGHRARAARCFWQPPRGAAAAQALGAVCR
jgi:predicted nucleotidyltransferase